MKTPELIYDHPHHSSAWLLYIVTGLMLMFMTYVLIWA